MTYEDPWYTEGFGFLRCLSVQCGTFNGPDYPFKDLPDKFVSQLDNQLAHQGFRRGCKLSKRYDVAIEDGYYQLQWHDFSVEEHTDELNVGQFFAIVPYEITIETKHVRLGSLPDFTYFSPENKKYRCWLDLPTNRSEIVVFNPRRAHKLDYYGRSIKLMLFTVIRNQPNEFKL